MIPLLHRRLLPRLPQLRLLHRRLLPHLPRPVLEETGDAQPATSNRMGGLFSSHKEENPTITVENVIDGDINDSSTHYKVHKEAATAAGITFGVIAVISILGCFYYYFQKARKDSAFVRIQRAARKQMAVTIPMTPFPTPMGPPPPPPSAPPMYAPPTSVFAQSGPYPVCPE